MLAILLLSSVAMPVWLSVPLGTVHAVLFFCVIVIVPFIVLPVFLILFILLSFARPKTWIALVLAAWLDLWSFSVSLVLFPEGLVQGLLWMNCAALSPHSPTIWRR